ncbi:MAG: GrpB family protein [Jatrophihabitans sp.]
MSEPQSPAVVDYDARWPVQFQAERSVLREALGDLLVTDVEHIGSTAIPTMPAKPLIDMMAGIARLADADAAEPLLAGLGYARQIHRVDAVLFSKVSDSFLTHSLQLTTPGSDLWQERLAFRDAVRADPALVAEYAELKARLLRATGGAPYDARDKREFVRRVLRQAGLTLRDDRHAPGR